MEENQPSSIFDTEMDGTSQYHLASISKWARIISITGFICGGLILLMLVVYGNRIVDYMSSLISTGSSAAMGAGLIIGIAVIVILVFMMWFYFLFRSAMLLQQGVKAGSTADIANGFKSLRTFFIISIVISAITILSNLLTILNN